MTTRFVPSSYSYLWREDVGYAMRDMAEAGFATTELMAALPHVDLWHHGHTLASDLRSLQEETGLGIAGVNPPGLDINISSPEGAFRHWSVEMYTAIGRLAVDVGAEYLVVHPGKQHSLVPAPPEQAARWVLESVGTIAERLGDTGLRIFFENTPTGVLDSAEDLVWLAEELDAPNVSLVYDVANGFMVEDPRHGLRTVAAHLGLVHVSDTTVARWLHDPVGSGEVDWAALAETVDGLGFDGPVVLETVHPGDAGAGLRTDVERLEAAGWRR